MVVSPLGHVWSEVLGFNNDAKYKYHLVEGTVNSIRMWLVVSMTFLPLLHSVLAGCYSSCGSQLGNSDGYFSTLVLCVALPTL